MPESANLEDQPIAWTPTPEVIERAQLTKFMRQVGVSTWDELYAYSNNDVEMFTAEVLRFLDIKFDPPYEKLLDTSDGIEFPNWCSGGGLNITEMCLDRWQTDETKDQPAVIWEGEDSSGETLTYAALVDSVESCAAGLRLYGFGKGDAIGIHLPMLPETVIALLGINRIGAIAVPVFSGYGVEAIASRMKAVAAKGLFTCNGFYRRGKLIEALRIAKEAIAECPSLNCVFVVGASPLDEESNPKIVGFDFLLDFDAASDLREPTSAEDPLIILYTSGTTGKPKGIAHTHASFPIKAAQDMAFGTDVGKGTRICWYTDIGWMMGPWLIYGALINGATICIYDGAPDYPTRDRMWEFCAKHKVEVLGISPTLIRSLAAAEERNADTPVGIGVASTPRQTLGGGTADADKSVRVPFERHDLSSLRIFASTGEPWNPDPWWWLFEKVGNSKLPIINYSGGTEIAGGILMGNPLLPIKPCSFPAPCPGMDVDILDEEGNSVPPGQVGELVIKQPWIGMARGFWQEKERYLETYWRRFKNIWVHGDWAMRDKDGHWFILGRSDDTLKVAGKRVGPAEVESILVSHPQVTEAAVIGVPDEAKGTAMVAFVVRNADALVRPGAADAIVRTSAAAFANKRGWHTRGYLPHFDGVATQFITFRLADSLPQNVLRQIKQLSENDPADPAKEYRKRVEEYLDRGIGECLLRNPVAAKIVEETLQHEDGKSIRLIAWVIMPNHAHIMMRPLEGHSLSDVMQTVKSVSAHRINKELGRKGAVWQPDYFDRFIRDEQHFAKALQYVHKNPVKAGLCKSAEDWEFSSAALRTHADEGVRDPGADEGVRVPLEDELKALVARDMGKPLAPSRIYFVSALPKTRNAKVMRRVVRATYLGEDAGDLSALEDPAVLEEISEAGRSRTDNAK